MCAACYSACGGHTELPVTKRRPLPQAFEKEGMLERLEPFCSLNGPAFYGVPPNTARVTLNREEWTIPDSLPYCGTTVVPFRAGTKLHWRLQDRHAA